MKLRRTVQRRSRLIAVTLWWCLVLALATAQPAPEAAPTPLPQTAGAEVDTTDTSPDPLAERADAAVESWLQQEPLSITQLSRLDTESLCQELPALLSNPAPPPGTEVRLTERMEQSSDDPNERIFTYAAVRPGNQLDIVEVRLRQEGGEWTAEYVGFRSSLELTGTRAWLQTPTASWLFVGFTLLVVLMLLNRQSVLRRWLRSAREVIKEHRRLVAVTLIALYAIFGLGVLTGSALPETCEQAILDVVSQAIGAVGATDAYGSGNVARAAATTFYQNFVVVTASVTFSLAAILGVPAYIFAAFSFFTQGIPFGLLGGGSALQLLSLLVLLVLELTSYFLVVAGGGMLLATIFSRRQGAFVQAYRKLLLMLPIAGVLLLIGAWYEALLIILGS